MSSRLRALRRGAQILFLAVFVLLFAFTAYPLKLPVAPDLFLRADPLLALSTMLSLRQIALPLLWFALPVVVVSLLLGRVFCGWVCPMGTCIDLCERVFRIRGRRPSLAPAWRRVKFYLLVALLLTMALPAVYHTDYELGLPRTVGLSAVYLVDPIALLTRTFALAGLPAAHWLAGVANDSATAVAYSDFASRHPTLLRALAPVQLGFGMVSRPPYLRAQFRFATLSFAIFAGIVALGSLARRFWCRNLCPLGALLGFLGKASPLRLAVSEKCTRCMRCVNECKVGAISEDPHHYSGPECIGCYSCIAVCPERAISLTTGRADSGRADELRLDRRRVLQAAGIGLAAAILPKLEASAKRSQATEGVLKASGAKLIRPPGALPEDEFVTACVRCGECMKVCPTNALQPALLEGGLEALGTPILVPRIGACAQSCNACGQVCPTDALRPFTVEEKAHLYLGTAVIHRSLCIAWAADRQCLVCDEGCPFDAISQRTVDGLGRPVVNDRVCVGCGFCESICPVEPDAAIRVTSAGDRRHWSRPRQQVWREQAEQEDQGGLPYPGL